MKKFIMPATLLLLSCYNWSKTNPKYCDPSKECAPTITNTYPNSITVGTPVTLTITGTNLGDNGTLIIGGRTIPPSGIISITNEEIKVQTEAFPPSTPTCAYMNLQYIRSDSKAVSRDDLLRSKRAYINITQQISSLAPAAMMNITPHYVTTLNANGDNLEDLVIAGISNSNLELRYLIKDQINSTSTYKEIKTVFTMLKKETIQVTKLRPKPVVGTVAEENLIEYGREPSSTEPPPPLSMHIIGHMSNVNSIQFPSRFIVNDIQTGFFSKAGQTSPDVIAVPAIGSVNPEVLCFDPTSKNIDSAITTAIPSPNKILRVVVGDINNDQFDDFIAIQQSMLASGNQSVSGYHRVSSCKFELKWTHDLGGTIIMSKIIDLNSDGLNDILLITNNRTAYVRLGRTTDMAEPGTFTAEFKETSIDIEPPTLASPNLLADIADMDCDGTPDIITAQGSDSLIDYFETIPDVDGVTFRKHILRKNGAKSTPTHMTIQKFNDQYSQNRIILLFDGSVDEPISFYLTGSTP